MSDSNEKPRNIIFEERVSQAKVVRKIVFFCVIALVLIVGILGISGFLYVQGALNPMDEEDTEVIEVTIPIGSSTTKIGSILEEEGLIQSGTFFRYYVRYQNETGFQAGDYGLSRSMSLDEIIEELKEGRVLEEPELVFTVPEGLWLEDIASIIAEETGHDIDAVMETLNDREYLEGLIAQYHVLTDDILQEGIRYPLEGYLFPARYDFMEAEPSIEAVIEAMLSRTEAVVGQYEELLEQSDYTIHEILTLASIIEREAQTSEDRYKISGVLHNRLQRGMMLQVDPTVAYAIGEHRYMTTYADTREDSPYNTYRYEGIPIGPIASPGQDSIEAVLRPEETNYLFFYARFNGEVLYSETYEEHNAIHQRYRDEWVEGQQQEEESE
ncbi:endolytic transglycosylase MltG [Halalkalibacterium ligniniphilum]|uniref:endolytic transglycosylase MltG n=1 Tax=Halalkalibacterium ligniniphilum TaxID=1134413 RepID=UPI00034859BD|nr:endolytic transglycosylase MltG [Halalkalibacterium ligniniphilum]